MRNNTVKRIFLGAIVPILAACNANNSETATAGVDKEQIKKEIQAKEDEFAATYNGNEMKNIGYYADDATTFQPNRAPLVGKKAIVEFLKEDLASNSNKLSFTTNEVFVSSDGNQIVELGYFKLVDSANNTINTGNYMSLFVKKDGKYTCLRDMSASDTPLP